ncbi:MAG: ParB/RepB/Spo0J family partition protein [Actinomycetes bacterium]|jgi:ParB family transcriptional regulator, chromosome partitioning protein
MSTRKGGLGRGLDTLIPTSITSPTGIQIADRNEVDINSIVPNPKQPRTIFDADALAELSASIKEVGLLQPPVVRDMGNGTYELIMGERRLRASKLAGLKTIPVIIRQTPDNELLREALLENIHRSQLNPLEEGSAYQNLLNDFGYTHEELASKVGKSRSAITNTLRLLNLPAAVQRRVAAGVLSAGHARALLTLNDESEIEKLANRINAEGLSVRATEEIVATTQNTTGGNNSNKPSSGKGANSSALTARLKEVADEMGSTLDTRVTVELGKQKGKITIEFATLEDLERIAGLI